MKMTEFELDNKWYEAFADKVHMLGKQWPDLLTAAEFDQCTRYADSKVRRPVGEVDKQEPKPSFTCPRCHKTTHNSDDVFEGYCGRCHDWTR